MLFTLTVPADNDRGPQYMEQALAAIHQTNLDRLPIELMLARRSKATTLACRAPPELAATLTSQLAAHYPTATITRLADDALASPPDSTAWSAEFTLCPDLFPIRRYAQFDDVLNRNTSDPLTAILAALACDRSETTVPMIVLNVRPSPWRRVRQTRRAIHHLSRPFFREHPVLAHYFALAATSRWLFIRIMARLAICIVPRGKHTPSDPHLTAATARTHEREDDLQAASDKLGRHVFQVHLTLHVSGNALTPGRARLRLCQVAGAFGEFTIPRMARFRLGHVSRGNSKPRGRGFLLSTEELATLWHPATATVRAPAMEVTQCRELEPPVDLPIPGNEPDVAALARVKFRGASRLFGIRPDDRRRHLAIIGKTGMGKTTLLQKLIAADLQGGRGLALIDPHGDLADGILDLVPTHRTNAVVLFDAGDRHYPLSFNVLACREANQRGVVASGIVCAFKKLYGESWGPRLEHLLRNALLALLETPGTSLLSVQRLLSDTAYRRQLVSRLRDPVVRAFWEHEYASWKPQYQAEAVAPVLNKVGQFLSQPVLRAIVGQARSSLDLRSVLDEGRILVVNLSKGRIGEDASTLLGSLLVTAVQLAAMSRADVPEKDRRDFALYVDEFQCFATESFATILSEARKYRLSLVLANQYLAQMDEATMEAVFGNVGSLMVFQVGARDAETLAEQLGGDVTPQDLLALPKYTAYLRLLVDGIPSRPFSVQTVSPPRADLARGRAEVIRRTSRHRYSRSAALVEAEIRNAFSHAA